MKFFLRMAGIFFVILGFFTILFYGYCGYKAIQPHQVNAPPVGAAIFLVVMGIFLLVTGIGLVMLKRFALYAAVVIGTLGIWGTCIGARHGDVVQAVEFVIFFGVVICSVIYLLQGDTKSSSQ